MLNLKLGLHAGMRDMILKRRPNSIAMSIEEKLLLNTSDHQYLLLLSEIEEAGVVKAVEGKVQSI